MAKGFLFVTKTFCTIRLQWRLLMEPTIALGKLLNNGLKTCDVMKVNKLIRRLLYRKAKDTFNGPLSQKEYMENIQIGKKLCLLLKFYV